MYNIQANNIRDAHEEIVHLINNNGMIVRTEDREFTLELYEPLSVHIARPLNEPMILEEVGFSRNYMEEYAVQLGYPSENTFSYTYGNRLRNYNGYDQKANIINVLSRNRTSRRAIMHTWMVDTDSEGVHVPCMQTVQFLRRTNPFTGTDYLNCIATFRSNDMLMAWGCNAYGLVRLQESIAEHLDCVVGWLNTISSSAHIYFKRDETTLRKIVV